jgi:hypothetical protein
MRMNKKRKPCSGEHKGKVALAVVGTTISHDKRLKLNVKFFGNGAFVTLRAAFLAAERIL